jgi:tRNA threonylcarbamoyl adenosine modification protein YeaZ
VGTALSVSWHIVLVLAFDTSSAAVTAEVVDVSASGLESLAREQWVGTHGHSEHLTPTIAACLDRADSTVRDLAALVVGAGPGPFTGLRVGLVTAAAMAEALEVPAYEVCSLDGIVPAHGDVLVATDARRKEVYWATYHNGHRVDGPHVNHPSDVRAGASSAMTGAGARLYAEVLGLPLLDIEYPRPAALVAAALDRIRSGAPSDALTPLYLRRPDAVVPKAMLR